jgi:hypothetical protein
MLYGPDVHMLQKHEKYVRTALRLALWELWHAPDFEQAMIDVINRGGDADTNAAVAGAVYGAWVGESGIPQRWIDTAMDALREAPGHLANTYHPKNLVLLAGAKVDPNAKPATPEKEILTGLIRG